MDQRLPLAGGGGVFFTEIADLFRIHFVRSQDELDPESITISPNGYDMGR
jgi:hypothetical protein